MRKIIYLMLSVCLLCTSCYQQPGQTNDAWMVTEAQMDSISFYTAHHYTKNYNFLVKADSLPLVVQPPAEVISEMLVDTVYVKKKDVVVVADIMTISTDTIDSVWVQVARDQQTIGWTHENDLLTAVAPDNPISQFIDRFSDQHLLVILAFVVLVGALYVIMKLARRNAKIVHFNDIPSFYPTLLAILVAASAVFYSTIQLAAPDSWRHYYYHPTLNPFAVPLHLELFLFSVWAMLVVAMAAFDEIYRRLSASDAILYGLGLIGVCAANYVVFSISTLYYVGYPLLAVYVSWAVWRYHRRARRKLLCGRCGAPISQKGACPHCGAINE